MKKMHNNTHRIKRYDRHQYVAYLYLLPWIVGFLVFQLYPLLASLFYSFTNYDLVRTPTFVGLDNYKTIFTMDRDFIASLRATFLYVVISVPGKLIFALFIALLLNLKVKWIKFFRTAYYLPSILGGSVAISIVWKFLFMKDGTVNRLLQTANLPQAGWLSDKNLAIFTLSLLTIWQFGSSMVIFLGGLKQIPNDLYESAKVEGATSVKSFFHITIPMITPLILFNLVMQMINAFQEFTAAFVVTSGGPVKSTYLYAMKLYDEAFKYYKMGYSAALSWVLFAIILVFTLIIFKTAGLWVFYSDGGDQK